MVKPCYSHVYLHVCMLTASIETYSHFHNDDCLFFFLIKKKLKFKFWSGSVFVLSVQYQYSFFFMLKKDNHYENESRGSCRVNRNHVHILQFTCACSRPQLKHVACSHVSRPNYICNESNLAIHMSTHICLLITT
jgi:hypothetical protein